MGDVLLQRVGFEEIPVSEEARKAIEEQYGLEEEPEEEEHEQEWMEEDEGEEDEGDGNGQQAADGAKTVPWPKTASA